MAEQQVFESALRQMQPQEEQRVLRIVTSWMEEGLERGLQEGRQEGRQEGKQEGECKLILRFIQQRFPDSFVALEERIRALSLEQLDRLGDRLFGFESVTELETWLQDNIPNTTASS